MTPGRDSVGPIQVAPGDRLVGKYLVERVAGVGGMSVVVAARHEQLDKTVAIKLLAVSTDLVEEAVARFLREARAAASLRSEHIARVTDVDVDELGRHFIVMEYLEGDDLAAILRDQGPLPVEQAIGYLLHACEGVAEAHATGILHRDLKPQNLFLTQGIDGTPLVKVLDFGISKIIDAGRPAGGFSTSNGNALLGTPLYMSPEQLRAPGDIDARSDVWALGVILYELLTGRRPFAAPTLPEILAAILSDDEPPSPAALRPELPEQLTEVLAICLAKDLGSRCPSAGALAQALLPWAPRWARAAGVRATQLAGLPAPGPISAARRSDPARRAVTRRRRGRAAVLVISSLAMVALLAGAALSWRRSHPSALVPLTRPAAAESPPPPPATAAPPPAVAAPAVPPATAGPLAAGTPVTTPGVESTGTRPDHVGKKARGVRRHASRLRAGAPKTMPKAVPSGGPAPLGSDPLEGRK